jgi:hypothetical protein
MKLARDYINKIEKQLGEPGKKIDYLTVRVKTEVKLKNNIILLIY